MPRHPLPDGGRQTPPTMAWMRSANAMNLVKIFGDQEDRGPLPSRLENALVDGCHCTFIEASGGLGGEQDARDD